MTAAKCVGIWGRLFGHRFKTSTVDWVRFHDHCTRCGMPKGGWRV
jgi:hypothetical protein